MEGEKYNSLWELRIEFAADTFRFIYFIELFKNFSV
jgi:hypothetical protein